MDISEIDARFLLERIHRCETILILGAGASFGGKNARDEPIKMGEELAKLLAENAGLS